jgi:hypothetical protein
MSQISFRNEYIDYLNSLHNISASGGNALAESQALNKYFPEIYEPFPIVDDLLDLLKKEPKKVIILTGHAGDGKSTIALDIFKKLQGIPLGQPLNIGLKEKESIESSNINLIKDMSELSIEQRKRYLIEAFSEESGNWLIVSNTGPLLDSIKDYVNHEALDVQDIESNLLRILNLPYDDKITKEHYLEFFKKSLIIINLTKLDNVDIGSRLLTRLVNHPSWNKCSECHLINKCPIKSNHRALTENIEFVSERVRYIYLRLNKYGSRLTLRQIIAQLSFSITGGSSCYDYEHLSGDKESKKETLKEHEKILFSEAFFGFKSGKKSLLANELHAISVIGGNNFGAPLGPSFERNFERKLLFGWAEISESLKCLTEHWKSRSQESESVRVRGSLRRLAFIFGLENEDEKRVSRNFFDCFLDSKVLLSFDEWCKARRITLAGSKKKRFKDSCLRVLLEAFTGFRANQFRDQDRVFLTLKRPDGAVIQPTQLVLQSLPMYDFELQFNSHTLLPEISFRSGKAVLQLSLPLVDYIFMRSEGEIGSSLSPIYKGQIDWFSSELLKVTANERKSNEELEILRSGIDGEVKIYRYLIDVEKNMLELY